MFDEKKARRVIRFIECLKHTKGEFHGRPFKLLPWQEKIIRDVFGTVRDEDPSMRQYNQVYIEIGKKNGKSELGAALALNMLINDDEWKAEVYSCASDRQQAAIVFDVAVDMVRQNPTLSKLIKIIPSTKRMVYQPTGSIYQVLSSEVATKHGLNVSACIFDELVRGNGYGGRGGNAQLRPQAVVQQSRGLVGAAASEYGLFLGRAHTAGELAGDIGGQIEGAVVQQFLACRFRSRSAQACAKVSGEMMAGCVPSA